MAVLLVSIGFWLVQLVFCWQSVSHVEKFPLVYWLIQKEHQLCYVECIHLSYFLGCRYSWANHVFDMSLQYQGNDFTNHVMGWHGSYFGITSYLFFSFKLDLVWFHFFISGCFSIWDGKLVISSEVHHSSDISGCPDLCTV